MMMISNAIKMELAAFENMIETVVSENMPPIAVKFFENSPKVQGYINTFEDMLVPFMDEETGEIDGVVAGQQLKAMFPQISEWVSIPQRNFKITEIMEQIMGVML